MLAVAPPPLPETIEPAVDRGRRPTRLTPHGAKGHRNRARGSHHDDEADTGNQGGAGERSEHYDETDNESQDSETLPAALAGAEGSFGDCAGKLGILLVEMFLDLIEDALLVLVQRHSIAFQVRHWSAAPVYARPSRSYEESSQDVPDSSLPIGQVLGEPSRDDGAVAEPGSNRLGCFSGCAATVTGET